MKHLLSLLAFSSLGLLGQVAAQAPQPVHFWDFNGQNGGMVADQGTASAPLSLLSGATVNQYGVNNYGLTLPSGSAAASYQSGALTNLTVMSWFRSASLPDPMVTAYSGRITETPAYTLFISNEPSSIVFEYRYDDFYENKWRWEVPESTLELQWHQAAVVYDPALPSNVPTLYLDGEVVNGGEQVKLSNGAPVNNQGTGFIGNRAEGDRRFYGKLDEVRIYDALLNQQQIRDASIRYLDQAVFEFFDKEYREGDWIYADWLDWVYVTDFPWIYSPRHGWMMVEQVDNTFANANLYFTAIREDNDQPLGWAAVSRAQDQQLYSWAIDGWIEHMPDAVNTRYWDYTNEVFITTHY